MNRFIHRKHHATISVVGMLIALTLLSGAVWAEKKTGEIEVKTDKSTVVQSNPTDQQAPDYMSPVREMIQMQREMDRFFGMPFASFNIMPPLTTAWDDEFIRPNMDLREQTDAYHVQIDLPGMDKSGIAVEVKDNILTVKAENKTETTRKDGEKLLMQERSSGFMSRAVMLAKPVDAEKVTASYKDGVLKITLPKVEADKAPKKNMVKGN